MKVHGTFKLADLCLVLLLHMLQLTDHSASVLLTASHTIEGDSRSPSILCELSVELKHAQQDSSASKR